MILLVLCGTGSSCTSTDEDLQKYRFSRLRMGARANLVIHAPDEQAAQEAANAVFERISELEHVLSDWQLDSEVSRLRSASPGSIMPISDDLDHALESSIKVSKASQGVFDVTCGRMTSLWRESRRLGTMPSAQAIEDAQSRGGWEQLKRVEGAGGTGLQCMVESPWLDFGGIGKGIAADEGLAVLQSFGLGRSLVELGGDMAIGQPPPGKSGWKIGIDDWPDSVILSDCGVATSGTTEQYLMADGRKASHLLDARTGQFVADRGAFTVIAPTATQADAWASVATIVGIDEARRLVESNSGILFMEDRATGDAVPAAIP